MHRAHLAPCLCSQINDSTSQVSGVTLFASGSPCESTEKYGLRLPQYCMMLNDPRDESGGTNGLTPVNMGRAGAVASRAALKFGQ